MTLQPLNAEPLLRTLARGLVCLVVLAGLLAFTRAQQPGALGVPVEPAQELALPQTRQDEAVDSPELVADAAVREWLQRTPIAFDQLSQLDAEQLCRELPGLVTAPPPPPGTEVRFDDRVERPVDEAGVRVFTYAAIRPGDQLDVVEVRLEQQDGRWQQTSVGFLSTSELSGVRAWLQTPTASWLFIAFTVLIVVLLINPNSGLRRWLGAGRLAITEHRRLVIGTVIALFGLFGLGVLTGSTLPDSCDVAVMEIVESAITSLGATAAYGSGDVPRAAATTFYQNFVVVTLSVTFTLSAILGVPGYLYAAASFFVQGIPFGLVGGGAPTELLALVVLVLLELTAYFIVVAGGGMLLATVVKRGIGQLGAGFAKLLLMLPIAMLLLLTGAWYEAVIIILGF
jgi:hypothetical protein